MSHLAEINIRTFEAETNNYILYTVQYDINILVSVLEQGIFINERSKSFGRINLTVTKSAVLKRLNVNYLNV